MTEEQKIIDGNKLMTAFLKPEKAQEPVLGHTPLYPSWNWLIRVVEKIESIHDDHHGHFGVYINGNSCTIHGTNLHKALRDLEGYGSVYFDNVVMDTKLESTWNAVVNFIAWYNDYKIKT